ncbi:MAG TPA: hypothetical protein VFU38_05355, partial [Candidatus Krumholzibacteria bacterium]|nr:hypothetical protein [Candidatus Krumholzibacteria bacterium]
MRVGALLLVVCAMFPATRAWADSTSVWDGSVRLGGVIEDEEGDRSVMQETFNIHEGFTLTKLRLNGRFNRNTHLYIDADNLTLDGRRATLDLRRTGVGHFRSRYDENDFLFDPAGVTVSTRRDWWSNLTLTPQR